jgi:TIR domain
MAIEIFFSYSHKDQDLRDQLETQLSQLKQEGLISSWYDRKIGAGEEWEHEIDEHLNTAQIILLLVSPDFIGSEYCYSIEMKRAMERDKLGEVRAIPIILRPTDWHDTPLGKLQALPKNGKPITTWRNRDTAFLDVAKGIRKVINEITRNINSSNEKHEPTFPESVDFIDQNDDQVYKLIIREWVRCTDLDNWAGWSSFILTNRPTLSTERDDELIWLAGWLFERIWPKRYPVLNEAFINFRLVLLDFYHTFHKYSEAREGIVYVDLFYKKQMNSPTYHEDLKLYQYHVGLIHDLMLELTRAANYICDAVRQFIDPTFRLVAGKVLVRRDFVFYENGEIYDYELFLPEYQTQGHILHPYPGLEQFKIDRENRDIYFGDII